MGNVKSLWACLETYSRLQVVQVLRPDGKYEEFADPIEVSEVMRMHPEHLVVHCSSLDRPVNALSKIMIMRLDQELAVGQSYLLHPIPSQYRKTMFKAQSIPLPRSPLGLGPETEALLTNKRKLRKVKKLNGKRAKRLAALRDLCANLLQPLQPAVPPRGTSISDSSSVMNNSIGDSSPSILSCARRRVSLLALSKSITEAPEAPLLDSRVSSLDNGDEKPKTSFGINGWRPALDSIPESPGRSFGSDLQSSTSTIRYHLLVSQFQDIN